MKTFELVDVDIGRQGEVIQYRDDIALIDADTVLYASAVTCEVKLELLGKEFYLDEEWEDILSNPLYDKENSCIWELDIEVAYKHAKEKIQGILDATGCKSYELHFTEGRESFRYTRVSPEYKNNRIERTPTKLLEFKQFVVERDENAYMWTEWEADDIVVAKKDRWPDKYLLVSVDKDVLYSLAGTHFNYYSSVLHKISMKFITVEAVEAMKHHYRQTLTGDTGDAVYGLKRVGPKTADKLLAKCKTPSRCWEVVLKAYRETEELKNGNPATEVEAIMNMRLVSMNQLIYVNDNWEVKLWKPNWRKPLQIEGRYTEILEEEVKALVLLWRK